DTGAVWTQSGRVRDALLPLRPPAGHNSTQRHPALCDDGQGGCVIVWVDGYEVPQAIWDARISSSGNVLWGYRKGVTVYKGPSSGQLSYNPSVIRDGNIIFTSWETENAQSQNGRDIYAHRQAMDSSLYWSSAAEVSGANI